MIVFGECGFPKHSTTELSRVLALKVLEDLLSLSGIQVHLSICGASGCWETKINKSIGIVRVQLQPCDPQIERDISGRSTISPICVVEESASRALRSVVKLNEDCIEICIHESIAEVEIGHDALRRSSDNHRSQSAEVVNHRGIVGTLCYRNGNCTDLNVEVETIYTRVAKRTRSSPRVCCWAESSI